MEQGLTHNASTEHAGAIGTGTKRDPHNLVGKTIGGGRYRVESVIGIGGMGVVYKGRQEAVDRVVAIKVLMPQMVEDESLIKRFHLEARAASRLAHPNTITIHDFGREGDLLYIVMEFLEGESLQNVLKRETQLSIERTCHIIAQACTSLAEAHSKGIVHRDIKPDNIFLKTVGKQQDFVKVLDFGVAKLRDPSIQDATVTQAGMIFGTPKYMSPEQAKAKKLDGRSDIYALGVVMYECLLGRPPFLAEDPVSILIQHVHDPPPRFYELRPDLNIPEPLEAIVQRALAKDRQDRFPSADLMREAIEAFVESYRMSRSGFGSGPQAPYLQPPSGPQMSLSNPPPTGPMRAEPFTPPPLAPPAPPAAPTVMSAPAPPSRVAMDPHRAQTIAQEALGRPRDFSIDLSQERQWSGSHPATRMVRVQSGTSRAVLTIVLVLGVFLLAGVGYLVYYLSTRGETTPQTGSTAVVPGAASGESGAPSTGLESANAPALEGIGTPIEGAGQNAQGAPPATHPAIGAEAATNNAAADAAAGAPDGVTPTAQEGATSAGTPAAPGDAALTVAALNPGEGSGRDPAVNAAADLVRVRITVSPDDARLDFGERHVQRESGDSQVYLVSRSEGEVLEFSASAEGHRTRSYEESLAEPGDDGLVEVNVRLRRDRPRDPCVDPRTGLRDPYCRN